ncbi:MAG TPA: hypothetical protein VGX21_15825 [Methylomirabilota bacterium]|jgi:signal transduction histidine kinase|nr:hypothetical protein [Methylomirabilota bacterium]
MVMHGHDGPGRPLAPTRPGGGPGRKRPSRRPRPKSKSNNEIERLRARVAWLEGQLAEREQEAMARQARDEASRTSTSRLNHELRNRLGAISNAVYYLKLVRPTGAQVNEYLDLLEREVATVRRAIADYQVGDGRRPTPLADAAG